MANLTDEELDQIVKQSLPGYKVSPKSQVVKETQEADSRRATADARTERRRSEELRRRYLGADAPDIDESEEDIDTAEDYAASDNPVDDEDDEIIVSVEPEIAADPLDRGSRAKAAVISKKDKKVIGQQG